MNTVRPVHTQVAGRARYRIRGLKGSDSLKAALEVRLTGHPSVVRLSASRVTGRMLIEYDKAAQPGDIEAAIRQAVDAGPGFPSGPEGLAAIDS
ncbi:MAG: hypothetical protein MI892_17050, partial [Desulfobacterales bacterium]|nr:hypothetical protein [Desulfobacterales bacterium]